MVSVIIPNYNHATFLQQRISSIVQQTYQEIELIILDDCSTDDSKTIIEQFRNHPKIAHIVLNTENSGSPFIQWQRGFSLAKGAFIWIAESDDYADAAFLETVLSSFKNRETGISFCDSNIVTVDGNVKPDFYKAYRNGTFHTQKWNTDYVRSGNDEIAENLILDCTINNTSAMVFRKDLLQYVNFEDLHRFRYSGDWFFFISIALHTQIAYHTEALNYFRQGSNNFAKAVKSLTTHFKERSLVRYLWWDKVQKILDGRQRARVYKQLGTELRIQLNEWIKRKNNTKELKGILKNLYTENKSLFLKQWAYAVRGYVWKS